jgi:hypothetical protein
LAPVYIKKNTEPIPPEISSSSKFFPFFKNAIGALDGSHIPISVKASDQGRYRNRKKFISQNVLGVCNFDLTYSFVVAGWEGSATDSRVLHETIAKRDLIIPDGKFYLGDAGYGLSSGVVTPYRGVRYHLKEWGKGNMKPQNKKELFNLRHAQLRNVVERIFGVTKKRFPILDRYTENWSIETQTRMIFALFMLHNFIHNHGGDSIEDEAEEDHREASLRMQPEEAVDDDEDSNSLDYSEGSRLRDSIATEMWNDYTTILANRRREFLNIE